MTTDNRTGHLNLPLPHQDNLLEEDVQRLRASLTELDAHAEQTDTALAGKADAAATSAALAAKADAAAMQAALAEKSDAQSTQAAISDHAAKSAASEVGHVQLATDEEAAAGESADKAVNPKQLKATADAVSSPERNDQAASYKSSGSSATATGFKLLNDTDIGALFGKIDNVTLATAGSGNYVGSIAVALDGKTAKITQNKVGPSYCGYCSYCTYCTHCAYGYYCSYCTYCTYCNCNCNCDGN
ncbi:hypothetical protein [uncultured Desulfovibrio sp.]|uniref:hypothetical protein n=1 Tax=uncultured Desulfovibrio sp. TaxID=167968 RepID=UPI002631F653|nr:hypothetical protein [uncultured Desulfovibrio sp.]